MNGGFFETRIGGKSGGGKIRGSLGTVVGISIARVKGTGIFVDNLSDDTIGVRFPPICEYGKRKS